MCWVECFGSCERLNARSSRASSAGSFHAPLGVKWVSASAQPSVHDIVLPQRLVSVTAFSS